MEIPQDGTVTRDATSPMSLTEVTIEERPESDMGDGPLTGPLIEPLDAPVASIIKDGKRAWLVCLGAFILQVLIVGVLHAWGFFLLILQKDLNATRSQISWVGSITYGLSMLVGPIAGMLVRRYDVKRVTFVGCCICSVSLVISSFTHSFSQMIGTFSLIYGIGTSLAYTPTMTIAQDYFDKYLSVSTGIMTAGSSTGTLIMSPISEKLIELIGWRNTFRVFAGTSLIAAACCLLFQVHTRTATVEPELPPPSLARNIIEELSIWNNRVFIIWSLALTLVMFGYYIPYVHMVAYAKNHGIPESKGAILMMVLGGSTACGRILFGKVTTFKCMDRLHMHQLSMIVTGSAAMMLPTVKTFTGLVVYVTAIGLVDGCFVVLMPLITATFVGNEKATTAWGFVTMACSTTFTLGPPVAGWMYEAYGSYNIAFHVAGVPMICGAVILLFIPWGISSSQTLSALSTTSIVRGDDASQIDEQLSKIDEELLIRLTLGIMDDTSMASDMSGDNGSRAPSLYSAQGSRMTSAQSISAGPAASSLSNVLQSSTSRSLRDSDPAYSRKLARYMEIVDQYKKIIAVRNKASRVTHRAESTSLSIGTPKQRNIVPTSRSYYDAKGATSLEQATRQLRNTQKNSWLLGKYLSVPSNASTMFPQDGRKATVTGMGSPSSQMTGSPSDLPLYDANVDMTAGISTAELSNMSNVAPSTSNDAAAIEAEKIRQTVDARMEANMQDSAASLEIMPSHTSSQTMQLPQVLETDEPISLTDQQSASDMDIARLRNVIALFAELRSNAKYPSTVIRIHPGMSASDKSTSVDNRETTTIAPRSPIESEDVSAITDPLVPQGILVVPIVPHQCPSPVELCTTCTIRKKGVRFQDGILPTILEASNSAESLM